jgi:hypothetical protein
MREAVWVIIEGFVRSAPAHRAGHQQTMRLSKRNCKPTETP